MCCALSSVVATSLPRRLTHQLASLYAACGGRCTQSAFDGTPQRSCCSSTLTRSRWQTRRWTAVASSCSAAVTSLCGGCVCCRSAVCIAVSLPSTSRCLRHPRDEQRAAVACRRQLARGRGGAAGRVGELHQLPAVGLAPKPGCEHGMGGVQHCMRCGDASFCRAMSALVLTCCACAFVARCTLQVTWCAH